MYGIILNFGSSSTGVHSCFIDDVSLTAYLAPTPTPSPSPIAIPSPTPNYSQLIIPTYQPSPTNTESSITAPDIFLFSVSDNFIYLIYLILAIIILFIIIWFYMIIRSSLHK